MVKVETLILEGKISKINELELERYLNFFTQSYRDNLNHCLAVCETFPRWSIISGYYAMHDITKLLLASQFRLKMELEVHATAIKALAELIKNKELLSLIEKGYHEFLSLANDLAEAKTERTRTQYYTGTYFMKEEYKKKSKIFIKEIVEPFIFKVRPLTGEKDDQSSV
jgi:hypothetical protein